MGAGAICITSCVVEEQSRRVGGCTSMPGRKMQPKASFGLEHERGGAHAGIGKHSVLGVRPAHGYTDIDLGPA